MLGHIGDPRAVKPLLKLLKDGEPAIQGHAAEALRRTFLDAPGVREALPKMESEEAF